MTGLPNGSFYAFEAHAPAFQDALAPLASGCSGVCLLGEAGAGKSAFLDQLLTSLPDCQAVVTRLRPDASPEDVLQTIASAKPGRTSRAILTIDDADMLRRDTLDLLDGVAGMILSGEAPGLQLLLTGRPTLIDRLTVNGNRHLLRYLPRPLRLAPLAPADAASFFAWLGGGVADPCSPPLPHGAMTPGAVVQRWREPDPPPAAPRLGWRLGGTLGVAGIAALAVLWSVVAPARKPPAAPAAVPAAPSGTLPPAPPAGVTPNPPTAAAADPPAAASAPPEAAQPTEVRTASSEPPVPALPDPPAAASLPPEAAQLPQIRAAPSEPPVPAPPAADPPYAPAADRPATGLHDLPPPRGLPAGLLLVAGRGDTLLSLYQRVYRGLQPPDFHQVAAANPAPLRPGAVVVFPAPPNGWRPE